MGFPPRSPRRKPEWPPPLWQPRYRQEKFILLCIAVWLVLMAIMLSPALGHSACDTLRAAIAQYGEAAVLIWAKHRGYSDAQIAHVRKVCKL